jgi:hypothetical protein
VAHHLLYEVQDVDRETHPDLDLEGWLKTLGVDSPCQWDVLVFLHRHHACLVGAEYIARLLGHPTAGVVTALDVLESLGLVGRSRVYQGVRLYQFAVPEDPRRGDALDQLLALGDDRDGRLLLAAKLRRGKPAKENNGRTHLQSKRGARWLKAI